MHKLHASDEKQVLDSPRYMDGGPQKGGDVRVWCVQAESLADPVGKSSARQRAPSILLRNITGWTLTLIFSSPTAIGKGAVKSNMLVMWEGCSGMAGLG